MRRNDVASTSFRRHVPTRFLINQCQIITFLIIKSDNIENSRIELKGIVLQVRSNQIKVTFIFILPFNLVHLSFLPVSHRNWRKMWVDYWWGQRVCWPPSQNIAPPLFLRLWTICGLCPKTSRFNHNISMEHHSRGRTSLQPRVYSRLQVLHFFSQIL